MSKGKKISARHLAREWAMQFLFQVDVLQDEMDENDLVDFWQQLGELKQISNESTFNKSKQFAEELIRGVYENKNEIDKKISKYSPKWPIERTLATDRNILRVGVYELLKSDLSLAVIVDEAVEIAKAFGEADSPRYINALLENIAKDIGRSSGNI